MTIFLFRKKKRHSFTSTIIEGHLMIECVLKKYLSVLLCTVTVFFGFTGLVPTVEAMEKECVVSMPNCVNGQQLEELLRIHTQNQMNNGYSISENCRVYIQNF